MHSGPEDRIEFLRRRFRPGDRLNGTVVRYLAPNRAVIRIEGRNFAAWMQTSPPPGRGVGLVVDRLNPYIVLREDTSPGPGVNVYI